VSERFYVALARCDAGIRGPDRKNERAAVDEALPKFNALNDPTEPREAKPFTPHGRIGWKHRGYSTA